MLRKRLVASLVFGFLCSNAQAFTSTEYIDRITTEETTTTVNYEGEMKLTTTVVKTTHPNGKIDESTEVLEEEIYSSHYTELKESILSNSDRLSVLESLDRETSQKLADISANEDQLELDIASLTTTLAQLETEIVDYQAEIVMISNNISQMQAVTVESLEAQTDPVRGDLLSELRDLSAARANMQQAQGEFNSYNEQLDALISKQKQDLIDLKNEVTARVGALSDAITQLSEKFDEVVQSYCDVDVKIAILLASDAASADECIANSPTPINMETYTELNIKYASALNQLRLIETKYEQHTHMYQSYSTTGPQE